MQLNPARGRKLALMCVAFGRIHSRVYAAQPREGTETSEFVLVKLKIHK